MVCDALLLLFMVRLVVITLSQPTAFGMVSLYIPAAVQLNNPLGEVKELQAIMFCDEDELLIIVRLIVMMLSQPIVLGMVSR